MAAGKFGRYHHALIDPLLIRFFRFPAVSFGDQSPRSKGPQQSDRTMSVPRNQIEALAEAGQKLGRPALHKTIVTSPLGDILLIASEQALVVLQFCDERPWSGALLPQTKIADKTSAITDQISQELAEYFSGKRRSFATPVDFSLGGTPFQQEVWRALQQVRYGACSTYGALAASIKKPLAMRAVGAALGRNPLGIILPCHRILGRDSSLTGFAGGLHRKEWLLRLEGIAFRAEKKTSPAAASATPPSLTVNTAALGIESPL